MKKKLKLDLKKLTVAKLNNKAADQIKGGGYTQTCGSIATGFPGQGGLPGSIGSNATCVFRYINTVTECLRDS